MLAGLDAGSADFVRCRSGPGFWGFFCTSSGDASENFFAPTVSLSPSLPDAPACQDLPACLLQLEADGILPVFSTSMYQGHCEFPYIVCFIFGFAMLELVLKVILMLKKDDQNTYLTLTLMGTIFTSGPHHLGIPLGKRIKRMIAPG